MVVCGFFMPQYLLAQREIKGQSPTVQSTKEIGSTSEQKEKFNSLLKELEGTYQFQINKPEYKPLFSLELLERIQSSRNEEEVVYIDIDQFTKIIIPSKKDIESSSFQKLEAIIYKINE